MPPPPTNVRPLLLCFLHDDSASRSTPDPDLAPRLRYASPPVPRVRAGPVPSIPLPGHLPHRPLDKPRLPIPGRVPDRDLRGLRHPVRPVPLNSDPAGKASRRRGAALFGPSHPDMKKGGPCRHIPAKPALERTRMTNEHPVEVGYLALVCAMTMASAMRSDQLSMMLRARSPSHQLPSWAGASSVFMTAAA